jgi:hypothetical protein
MTEKDAITLKEFAEIYKGCEGKIEFFEMFFSGEARIGDVVRLMRAWRWDYGEILLLTHRPEITASAIKNGADIHTKSDEPLRRAVLLAVTKEDAAEIIKILVKNGAKANKNKSECLLVAVKERNIEAVKVLLKHNFRPYWEPLKEAVERDFCEIIKMLLENSDLVLATMALSHAERVGSGASRLFIEKTIRDNLKNNVYGNIDYSAASSGLNWLLLNGAGTKYGIDFTKKAIKELKPGKKAR